MIFLISTAVFTVFSKASLSHLITDPFRDCILNVNLQKKNKFLVFLLNGSYFFETSLSYTLTETAHHLFYHLFPPLLKHSSSFLNFPKKISRKCSSELLLSGSFSGFSQVLSLLSRMLSVCQPLMSSASIWWNGWLPLHHSRILVIRFIPPAAQACQQRSGELSFHLTLALYAKFPKVGPCCPWADCSVRQALMAFVNAEGTERLGRNPLFPEQQGERCQPADLRPKGTQPELGVSRGIQLHRQWKPRACTRWKCALSSAAGNRMAVSCTQRQRCSSFPSAPHTAQRCASP